MHLNHTPVTDGKSSAVCLCCNRQSRPVPVCGGEPDLWNMPLGWSTAPFSADFVHRDGSIGSTYTCPACNRRLRAGETLKLRQETPAAHTARVIAALTEDIARLGGPRRRSRARRQADNARGLP